MGVRGIFYIFAFASDMARSKRFYRDALGWELGTDEHGVAGFSFGTGYLVLHEDDRPAEAQKFAGGLSVACRWTMRPPNACACRVSALR